MITHISLITLWVTDQDEARDFYVQKLGFKEKADVKLGDGFRWVTVFHPDQPELEVTLMVPGPPVGPGDGTSDRTITRERHDGRLRTEHRRLPERL